MKNALVVIFAIIAILAMAVPAMAADVGVGTSVNVSTGGGDIPVVKCKWEQQPVAVCANLEDGDPSHLTPGFQLLPPLVKSAKKMIEYYAVVTDVEDGGAVSQAFADVYHPNGSPEPYGPSKIGGVQGLPYFKYEVPFGDLQPAMTKADAIAKVQAAYNAGLITFNTEYDLAEVVYELDKGTAHLWKGQAEIDYEQPAGVYKVLVFAVDTNNNLSPVLYNEFTYVAVCGIEIDFASISWGSVNLGVEKMIPGDTIWGNGPTNNATVRNIGNTWTSVTVKYDDMGFGKDVNNAWNVNFDARMGSDDTYYEGAIMPYEVRTLRNALALSTLDELDLSIKIIKGFGTHSGTLTLGCVIVPFADPVPANIVGVPD